MVLIAISLAQSIVLPKSKIWSGFGHRAYLIDARISVRNKPLHPDLLNPITMKLKSGWYFGISDSKSATMFMLNAGHMCLTRIHHSGDTVSPVMNGLLNYFFHRSQYPKRNYFCAPLLLKGKLWRKCPWRVFLFLSRILIWCLEQLISIANLFAVLYQDVCSIVSHFLVQHSFLFVPITYVIISHHHFHAHW